MRLARVPLAPVFALWASVSAAQLPPWLLRGERLSYSLTYLGVVGGSMVLEVSRPQTDGPLHFSLRADSSPFVSRFTIVDDRMETLIDPERVTTLISRKHTREGRYSADDVGVFDPIHGTARWWRDGKATEAVPAPVPVLDTLGAVVYLRTLPLSPGKEYSFSVQSGGKTYPLVVAVSPGERLHSVLGDVQTLVVEPRFREGFLAKKAGKLVLWLSSDETHTPVRIASELSFGSLRANLASIERPWNGVIQSIRGLADQGKE